MRSLTHPVAKEAVWQLEPYIVDVARKNITIQHNKYPFKVLFNLFSSFDLTRQSTRANFLSVGS